MSIKNRLEALLAKTKQAAVVWPGSIDLGYGEPQGKEDDPCLMIQGGKETVTTIGKAKAICEKNPDCVILSLGNDQGRGMGSP